MGDPLKCDASNDRLRPCIALAYRINMCGFHPMDTLDTSGAPRFVRRGVRHGKGKNAAALNFCPWCGGDLRPAFAGLREVQP